MSYDPTKIPTDSVLRRHWEAAHASSTSSKSKPAEGDASSSGGGLMAWLKRLFS